MKTTPIPASLLKPALCGLLLALGPVWSAHATVVLLVDVGTHNLAPNTPGQTVDLFIQNTGDTAFQAQGLTLRMQLDDGLGGGDAPIFSAVDAVTGTPWQGHTLSVNNQTTQTEFWDTRLLSNFFINDYAELGANSITKLATITFDTTGFTSGTWDWKLATFDLTPNPGDTKYNLFGTGDEVFPTINNGHISIFSAVPEPSSAAMAGLLTLGLAFTNSRLRRRVAPAQP